jgi:hypothetical protein
LFVHRDTGTGVAGRVDNIGGISKGGFPNLWLSTWEARRNSNSNAFGGVCPAIPARARTAAAIKRTAIHEFSHLMAAVHVSSTSTCTNSVMCLPAPAECGGGLQDPVWLEPSEPTAMDADNRARVNRHATCYLNKNTDWHDCMIMHVP